MVIMLLLVNGFWGISRHINYLGEILMASGIILCTGYPALIWPWLYPLYYVLLLIHRQRDDDKRCALKYGELWKTYVKKSSIPDHSLYLLKGGMLDASTS